MLAPLVVRIFLADGLKRALTLRDGIPAEQLHHSETYKSDAVNSMKVYGATYFRAIRSARTDHYVDVPVQVIVNTKDPYLRPFLHDETQIGCRGCGAATSNPATGHRCRMRR